MIPVHVHGVGMSPYNQGFVALLMDDSSQEWLPIYIGSFEAQAIAMELDDVNAPRPMTHDLIASVFGDLEVNVKRVVITDLRDGTFYANIILTPGDCDKEIIIDARPSDSIAVALRLNADIYVEEEVMEEAAIPAQVDEQQTEQEKKLKILQQRLQRAVEEEEFEEAAELRDEIQELKEEIHSLDEHPENNNPDTNENLQ
ncbi:MAG: bifunctional nuclease family protein [bacterium]